MSRNAFPDCERAYYDHMESVERAVEIARMGVPSMSYINLNSKGPGVIVNTRTAVTIEWIPVTSEMPAPKELVLASLVGSPTPVYPAKFDGEHWRDVRRWILAYTVTHWAHFPIGMHPARLV